MLKCEGKDRAWRVVLLFLSVSGIDLVSLLHGFPIPKIRVRLLMKWFLRCSAASLNANVSTRRVGEARAKLEVRLLVLPYLL